MKKYVLTFIAAGACVSAFAFTSGAGLRQIDEEVSARHKNGETLLAIASSAKSVSIAEPSIAPALKLTGASCEAVLSAMLDATYSPSKTIKALTDMGCSREKMNDLAIALGADPTTLLAATAAGGATGAAPTSFTGFSGNSFSTSRSATIGGGGSSSVSKT
jgi:hypothetical protein